MKYVATYAVGMCRTATDNRGVKYHAVETQTENHADMHNDDVWNTWDKALCGYKPGRRSNGWSDYRHNEVTCPKCLKKLQKIKGRLVK